MKFQLVLQFSASELTNFDELIDLELALILLLGDEHDVDGHDFGSGEMNIFIHTNDPVKAFKKCESAIPKALRLSLKAAYRVFSEDSYHWLYPEGISGQFQIT